MIILFCKLIYGGVAQLARASGSYPAGREFKSLRRYQEEFCSNFYSFEFDIQLIQKWISFFVAKNYPKRKDGIMVNIIKEELPIEESLKRKLELICEFSKTTPTIINGNIRKIDKTNLTYIEPNRIIIKDKTFLIFNFSNEIFIENLSNKIKLSELEDYLKTI